MFGFSPGMLNAGIDHYGMQFALLTPLMIEAVASIITGRGSPLAAGARLGLLAAAQLFTGEEMLTDVAIASLVLVAVLGASRPSAVRARLGGTALGLGVAAAVALLICAYGLWTQFRGPLTEYGTPWYIAKHGNPLGAFVNPQAQLLFHTASSAAYAASHRATSAEYLAYLGPPLLILVAGITIWYWRDLRVRSAGVIWVVLEALSLGVNGPLLPFHWLQGLPLLGDMFPSRMSILADGAAAAVLAFGLDLARSSAPRTAGPLRRAAPVVVALLAVLPLVPRPVAAIPGAQVPAGWDAVSRACTCRRTRARSSCPSRTRSRARRCSGRPTPVQPGELVAGWFLGPDSTGHAYDAYWGPPFTARTVACLDALWQGPASISGCAMAFAARARLLAPGCCCRGHQPWDAARAVPHQPSRQARHPGRATARLADSTGGVMTREHL